MHIQKLLPLIALLLVLAGCGIEPGSNAPPGEESADPAAATRVYVADLAYAELPHGQRILTGRLVNPTARDLRNVQIQVALYDTDNRSVGTMLVPVQNVPAAGDKEFRETVDRDDAAGARVRGIMGR